MAITNINGIPLFWNEEEDQQLFGQLFSGGIQPPNLNNRVTNSSNNEAEVEIENEYISPFVDAPTFPYARDKDIAINEIVSPISNNLGNNKNMYYYFLNGYNNIADLLKANQRGSDFTQEYSMDIYYEKENINKSNFFGTFILFNVGRMYKHKLQKIANGAESFEVYGTDTKYINSPTSFDGLVNDYKKIIEQETGSEISRDTVFFAMAYAMSYKPSGVNQSQGIFGLDEKAAEWIKELAKKVEKAKYSEADYNYTSNNKKENNNTNILKEFINIHEKIIDFLIPDNVEAFIKKDATAFIREVVLKSLPPNVQSMLEKLIKKAQEIHDFLKQGFDYAKNLLTEIGRTLNAFLMGLANGFLSLIQLLLQIIAWCVDKVLGTFLGLDNVLDVENYIEMRKVMESMEDMYDFISDNLSSFFDSIKSLWKTFDMTLLDKLFTAIQSKVKDKVSKITHYDIAYFCGAILFEIIFGVILALLTGGASVIAQLSTKAEKVAQILKIFMQEFISTITFGVVDIFKFFKAIITKFIAKAAQGFGSLIDYIIDILTKTADEIAEEAENIAQAGKKGPQIVQNSLVPLTPLQQRHFKAITNLFYKKLKKLLLKFADNATVMKNWYHLKPMKSLVEEDIKRLVNMRKLNPKAYNKNVAVMNPKVQINGKDIELQEFKAFAGDGINANAEGFCTNASKDYIAKQLEMSVDELMEHYKDIDEFQKVVKRFHDSEHKIFSAFDEELMRLKAIYGDANVKVVEMNFKTLYEPCISCKRQILMRKELYKVEKIAVEATKRSPKRYVRGNQNLKKIIKKGIYYGN